MSPVCRALRTTVLLALAFGLCASLEARTLIHAGRLIDGTGAAPRAELTIVVDGNEIVEVTPGFAPPADGDEVIDLKNATVLPGLIDLHVHLTGELSPASYVERFVLETSDEAVRAVAYAERTLLAGFTTVRNTGESGTVLPAVKRAIARGLIDGPRIYTAGRSIATTGGHGDPTNGMRSELRGDPGPAEGVANGVAEVIEAVRHRYKEGADLIKITATGGVLSVAKSGQNPQYTQEELDALVAAANDYGFHVAAHAHGAEGMKRAIRAGVRTIEHGTYMDEEAMELMKERGAYFVPTLLAGATVAERAAIDGYFPEVVRPKAAAIGPAIQATFARAYEAGVKIAFGTDSGVSPHGENARELGLMVEGGMPPLEAITAATGVAAEVLGAERLGVVAPGKLADLVAVEGDPLERVELLEAIDFVMKDGRVVKGAE